ncbi:RNA polymerase sigma factor [Variovorax sp. OV329]|uniref:RNA polymerase sigma factor n=1 Tax=Variovorax sp. OV329 TaxID=1882825 RepID=UPI0008E0C48E|nr:RNA polymerase sigma factor [Variovorax sp. OV329]SFM66451.1 RNA polymerase sigma-70 factor, ECF subfamily [Variovorax sp. OV329]
MNTAPIVACIPALRRYARALTGDAWAADDLVQDTLERACAKWSLWRAGSDLRAWLFTIMHNVWVNQLRRAGARTLLDIDDVAHDLQAPGAEPDLMIDLQRCLLQLPSEQRAVLLLAALEDFSYQEIAKVLDIPAGTVMSRLSRARARLAELMEGGQPPASTRPALRRLK